MASSSWAGLGSRGPFMGERGNISKKTGHIIRLLVCNNRKRADKLIDVIKLYAEKIEIIDFGRSLHCWPLLYSSFSDIPIPHTIGDRTIPT